MGLKRAISIDELYKMKFKMMEFEGQWLESFGIPEQTGVWLVWGQSGNGKTSFMIQLMKQLTRFTATKAAYDTLEEGARASFQRAARLNNLMEVNRKLIILDKEPIPELCERLRKPKSPDIIVIDSIQYSDLNKVTYKALKEEFGHKKLFIFNSHAEGRWPQGRFANFVRYDADVKIRVEGYRAFPVSRYGGGEPYTIWHEGAAEYYGEL